MKQPTNPPTRFADPNALGLASLGKAVVAAAEAARGVLADVEVAGHPNVDVEVARAAVEAALPHVVGDLLEAYARLLERAEWAEAELVRLRGELRAAAVELRDRQPR